MKCVVAVVDDDRRLLESMESLLESAGHDVRLFPSAEAFLEHCGFAEIDCLISDIAMPCMDGVELQRLAHATRPELPVIVVTGCDLTDKVIAAMHGNHGFFRKPFSGQELLAAVDKALPGRD
jgi:FixJ family two-component response regulator